MSRLIDADALKAESFGVYDSNGELRFVVDVNEIDEQPTVDANHILDATKKVDANHIADDGKKVDAVQVVRCGECATRDKWGCPWWKDEARPDDWYCADGERKDDGKSREDDI